MLLIRLFGAFEQFLLSSYDVYHIWSIHDLAKFAVENAKTECLNPTKNNIAYHLIVVRKEYLSSWRFRF